MKLTTEPTDTIVIKAQTNSEWDSCEFALVPVPDLDKINKVLEHIHTIKKINSDVFKVSFWDYANFYSSTEGLNETVIEFLDEGSEGWSFIEITEEELKNLEETEQKIDTIQMCVDVYNTILWKGYGKYTSEEFYTDDISVQKLEDAYKKEKI